MGGIQEKKNRYKVQQDNIVWYHDKNERHEVFSYLNDIIESKTCGGSQGSDGLFHGVCGLRHGIRKQRECETAKRRHRRSGLRRTLDENRREFSNEESHVVRL